LKIKFPQTFRAAEIALRIVRDTVSGEEIAEVQPKAQLGVMRVAVLESLDIANSSRSVDAVFKLRHSSVGCIEPVAGRELRHWRYHKRPTCSCQNGDQC